ncbi:calmodulin-lysine N-methyltransferase [Agrilus planipennis]|uniref:Calmodulin-lysine N-methyltransferase n=1 Tax=Agrilus planipennis TaxID=224129 RepID=A0A1W4WPJ1_AGRPL|nr:calmodulin-lysine N-methyltransferase [Agrilus planipennis]XP_018322034.1 calmodulin-lysine N-methyltransferase [Agrilus planipennis]
MDQSNAKYGLHPNGSIDLDQVLNSKNERKTAARRRWAILARALKSPTGSEPSSPTDEFSVRRISSFMLLTTQQLPNIPFDVNERMDDYVLEQAKKRSWYKYSMHINNIEYFLVIGHRNRTFSAEDLMGFNNTGNICIWPSEETLCYYIGSNFDLFEGLTIGNHNRENIATFVNVGLLTTNRASNFMRKADDTRTMLQKGSIRFRGMPERRNGNPRRRIR